MLLMYALSLITALSGVAPAAVSQYCKPVPGSPGWPSDADWTTLNSSVGGRLLGVNPPGSVCHPDDPNFNNASCAFVTEQWSNSSWHASNPWTTDYNDDTCLPYAEAPCSRSGYPAYAIEAISAEDVQAGVSFASKTGVRLIVKGTGHDYPGRSKGANSLEIWTHRLQGVSISMNDSRAVSAGAVGSMKIAAGMRWGEIYTEAAKNNLTVVGGADLDVGVGGWILNGGHSPISSLYGLGADQILEMEVVTADGRHRIINETACPDLFWALRGGGGSTYAILLSVTVKAYPSLPGTIYLFSYNTTASSDTFWSMTAYLHSQLPSLSESGAMGYYYVFPESGYSNPKRSAFVAGGWLFPKKTADQVKAIIEPLEKAINSSSWAKDTIYTQDSSPIEFPDFTSAWLLNVREQVGSAGRLGSWLLDGDALHSDFDKLKTQLHKMGPDGFIGHLIAGPGVRNAKIPGGSNAVLPAWRKAYTHVVVPVSWTPFNNTEKAAVTKDLREERIPALKSLAPNSGAYINEADPSNPTWQNDYYGDNYQRLLQIKKKWDPQRVFWCKPCVGHELWEVINGPANEDKLEWGIGQSEGRICKK